jgi:uncharacterized Zn finger protein (UPF0148 family)
MIGPGSKCPLCGTQLSDNLQDDLSISENEPRLATEKETPTSGTIIPDADHLVSDGARCPSCKAYLLLNKPKNYCPLCGARLPKYEGSLNPENESSRNAQGEGRFENAERKDKFNQNFSHSGKKILLFIVLAVSGLGKLINSMTPEAAHE